MKLITIAVMALSVSVSSLHAQILTDSWTQAGGAWTAANQPSYTVAGGGALYTDGAIAAHTNSSALNTNATLTVGAMTNNTQGPPGFLSDHSGLYTAANTPTFTLATTNVLAGANTISLTFDVQTSIYTSSSAALSLGGTLASFNSTDLGGGITEYAWTWDVSSLSSGDNFNISWNTPTIHSAFSDVQLTQSVQSVPEPSTWAMLSIGLGFFLWASRRKLSVVR